MLDNHVCLGEVMPCYRPGFGPDEVRRIHGEYQPQLLVYDVYCNSPEEGRELLDWLRENT